MGKDIINNQLATLSKTLKRNVAIVLDARKRCTTKALIDAGWQRNNIHIPNFSGDYKYIKRHHLNTYNISVLDFLELNKHRKYLINLLYLDYMCTLDRNGEVSPLQDIIFLFRNRMMHHNSILALTISMRGKNSSPFTNLDCIKAIHEVQQVAMTYGYVPELILPCGVYRNGGNMCSLIWRMK